LHTLGDDLEDEGMDTGLRSKGQEAEKSGGVGRRSGERVITLDSDVMGSAGVDKETRDSSLRAAIKPCLGTVELTLKKGRGEAVLLNGLHELVTLLEEVVIAFPT
jgi:hypothetical protein